MTSQQNKAVERLRKALDACHKVGLRGGVYEYSMHVWPADGPDPREAGQRFFEVIDEHGAAIRSQMILDGGAGV